MRVELDVNREKHVVEVEPRTTPAVIILGSGPNRIGQGIEFDYSCVHASLTLREAGYETIMVNCNPETVSTDFDMADKLYFEPVYWEHLWEIIEHEKPEGVIVQLGGQTALKLAEKLHAKGIKIIGTSFDSMDIAEDRGRFSDDPVHERVLLDGPQGTLDGLLLHDSVDTLEDGRAKMLRYARAGADCVAVVFASSGTATRRSIGQKH